MAKEKKGETKVVTPKLPRKPKFVAVVAKANFTTSEGFWGKGETKKVTPKRSDELRSRYPNIF